MKTKIIFRKMRGEVVKIKRKERGVRGKREKEERDKEKERT